MAERLSVGARQPRGEEPGVVAARALQEDLVRARLKLEWDLEPIEEPPREAGEGGELSAIEEDLDRGAA